jgi:hypothetical protein
MFSLTGRARQIVLLCHGGWSTADGYCEVPPPMLVHFYTVHGKFNTGTACATSVLKLGPEAYPGMIPRFDTPPRPKGITNDDWNAAVLRLKANFNSTSEGSCAIVESVGGSFLKLKVYNYDLSLIGPDNVVRPEEKALFDEHTRGDFSDDVDIMMFRRTHRKSSSLEAAFDAARKVNGGKDYPVFHYAPCRYVAEG